MNDLQKFNINDWCKSIYKVKPLHSSRNDVNIDFNDDIRNEHCFAKNESNIVVTILMFE